MKVVISAQGGKVRMFSVLISELPGGQEGFAEWDQIHTQESPEESHEGSAAAEALLSSHLSDYHSQRPSLYQPNARTLGIETHTLTSCNLALFTRLPATIDMSDSEHIKVSAAVKEILDLDQSNVAEPVDKGHDGDEDQGQGQDDKGQEGDKPREDDGDDEEDDYNSYDDYSMSSDEDKEYGDDHRPDFSRQPFGPLLPHRLPISSLATVLPPFLEQDISDCKLIDELLDEEEWIEGLRILQGLTGLETTPSLIELRGFILMTSITSHLAYAEVLLERAISIREEQRAYWPRGHSAEVDSFLDEARQHIDLLEARHDQVRDAEAVPSPSPSHERTKLPEESIVQLILVSIDYQCVMFSNR